MSMLTLHTFEFGGQIKKAQKDQMKKQRIINNIEAHTQYIKEKSEQMSQRMHKVTQKMGIAPALTPRTRARMRDNKLWDQRLRKNTVSKIQVLGKDTI